MKITIITQAIQVLRKGGVLAYPTEAVYGLGCDPLNEKAVQRLLQLKKRDPNKGLILVGSSWQQLSPFAAPIDEKILQQALATWPGPVTWVFPANLSVSSLLRGQHTSIALRCSAHPVIQALCDTFGGAIVSTSANWEGYPPAKNTATVRKYFADEVDLIIEEALGGLDQPTEIRDVMTGQVLRPGNG